MSPEPRPLPRSPSPYVSFYLARRQAMHVVKALETATKDLAPSHPLSAALRNISQAVGEGAG